MTACTCPHLLVALSGTKGYWKLRGMACCRIWGPFTLLAMAASNKVVVATFYILFPDPLLLLDSSCHQWTLYLGLLPPLDPLFLVISRPLTALPSPELLGVTGPLATARPVVTMVAMSALPPCLGLDLACGEPCSLDPAQVPT